MHLIQISPNHARNRIINQIRNLERPDAKDQLAAFDKKRGQKPDPCRPFQQLCCTFSSNLWEVQQQQEHQRRQHKRVVQRTKVPTVHTIGYQPPGKHHGQRIVIRRPAKQRCICHNTDISAKCDPFYD